MILSVLKALKYQAFPILTAIAIGLATASSSAARPELVSWLLEPGRAPAWHIYFRDLSQNKKVDEIGEVFRTLHVEMLKDGVASNYILALQKMRGDLPTEIRWLLAAHEIYRQNISSDTLADATSAVLHTKIVSRPTLLMLFSEVDKFLVYSDPHYTGLNSSYEYEFSTHTINNLMFVHSQWQRVSTLPEYERLDAETIVRLQKKKVDWMDSFEQASRQLSSRDIEEILLTMDSPKYRQFSDRTHYEKFCDYAKLLLYKIKNRLAYENPNFKAMKSKIMSWIDLDYQLGHFEELYRYGFANPEEIIQRMSQGQDIKTVERVLTEKLYLADAQILAALLAARPWQNIEPHIRELASRRAFDILFSAKSNSFDDRGVDLKWGLSKQWVPKDEFKFLIGQAFEIFNQPEILPQQVARDLLEKFSPRIKGQSDDEWTDWEWKRLQVAENSLPPNEFKEFLIQRASGESSSSLVDQIIAAKYLRLKMNVQDLEQVSLRLKSKAEGVKTKSFKEVKIATWSQEQGRLISVLKALKPDDPDLVKYLSMVYTTRYLEGAISPQKALQLLSDTSVQTPDMKQAMLDRLLRVSAGDSEETFKIFLKQFPQESLAIIDIIYNHRGVKEKIVPMMAALIEAAKENPIILAGVQEGLKKHPNKNTAAALYQGQTLDKWLQQKVSAVKSCGAILKFGPPGVSNGK